MMKYCCLAIAPRARKIALFFRPVDGAQGYIWADFEMRLRQHRWGRSLFVSKAAVAGNAGLKGPLNGLHA